jgi:hypothetical protein
VEDAPVVTSVGRCGRSCWERSMLLHREKKSLFGSSIGVIAVPVCPVSWDVMVDNSGQSCGYSSCPSVWSWRRLVQELLLLL